MTLSLQNAFGCRAGAFDLRGALEQRISDLHGVGQSLSLKGPVVIRPWAEVFYASSGAYPTPVGVKLFLDEKTGAPSSDAAKAAFSALSRAAALTPAVSQRFVAQPYELFDDMGVIVMEWVDGITFGKYIKRSRHSEVLWATRAAGGWLAKLHLSGGLSRGAIDTARTLSIIDGNIAANSNALHDKTIANAIAIIRSTADAVDREDAVWAIAHGDFKPDNLLVARDGLLGIDVELSHSGPAVADAAHFLNHLALQFYTPGGIFRALHQTEIERAFINGYEQFGGSPLEKKQLAWRRLCNAVRLHLTRGSWGSSLRAAVSGAQLRYLIQRLSREMVAN